MQQVLKILKALGKCCSLIKKNKEDKCFLKLLFLKMFRVTPSPSSQSFILQSSFCMPFYQVSKMNGQLLWYHVLLKSCRRLSEYEFERFHEKVIFYQKKNNSRPHTHLNVDNFLTEHGIKVIDYSFYSPELAPCKCLYQKEAR